MNAPVSAALPPASERARALEPLFDAHGAEMDRRCEATPEVAEGLFKYDMLRLLLPRSIGGQEIHLLEFAKTCEAVGRGDASIGWFVNQSNVCAATAAAAIPRDVAASIFNGPVTGLAWGAKNAQSKCIKVDGGYRLTGQWAYGSGNRHVKWLGAHSFVSNPDGSPHIRHGRHDDRTFLFPREKATIIDDWFALGLRGTGSDSYSVTDLFIPDDYAPARDAPEERVEDGPIYKIRSNLLYACGFCSVALGLARKMVEIYIDLARKKTNRSQIMGMAYNHSVQGEIGTLEARLSAARAFLHEAINVVYDAAADDTLTLDQRMRLRLATTFAMKEAADVSVACYRAGGTTAVMNSEPFERRFRDAMTVSQHLQGNPSHIEMVGRHMLGVENVIQWV